LLLEALLHYPQSLPDGVMAALADLVRAMNCYYSNLKLRSSAPQ
jgi:hypothetical protein